MECIIQEININVDFREYCILLKQLTILDLNSINDEKFKDQIRLILSNPLHKIYVAKSKGTIIGSVTILIEPKIIRNLSYVAHIEDVVVDSEYRSYGIGKQLMEKALNIATKYNCYKIILDCDDKNTKFYEKFGFEVKGNHMAKYLTE